MALSKPIGVFDSGIGGLTIASAIKRKLPQASIIYFGDTAHLPYGDKSATLIKGYIRNISNFLFEQDCGHLVVACNSASSVLTNDLLPAGYQSVLNVIDPVVNRVVMETGIQTVGVIGTRRTINSHVYRNRIKKQSESLLVKELATPLLAPMIEDGFVRNSISRSVIHEYLKRLGPVDALILGCTHYPLIRTEIQDYIGNDVLLLDAPDLIADQLVKENDISPNQSGTDHFYVSDFTESFEQKAQSFFGASIHLEQRSIHPK